MPAELTPPSPPDLRALLDGFKVEVLRDLNCHLLGEVVNFAPSGVPRASVKILSRRRTADGGYVDYPLLTDCPVFMPRGGAFGINLPVRPGDPCLVLFHDRDLDNWFVTPSPSVPNTSRQHSLSDGMVMVGFGHNLQGPNSSGALILYSANASVTLEASRMELYVQGSGLYSAVNIESSGLVRIRNSLGAEIQVTADGKVSIYNGADNLKNAVDNLCTVLKAWVNNGGTTPNDSTKTAIDAAKARFDALLA